MSSAKLLFDQGRDEEGKGEEEEIGLKGQSTDF